MFYRIHVATIKHLLKNEKKILEQARRVEEKHEVEDAEGGEVEQKAEKCSEKCEKKNETCTETIQSSERKGEEQKHVEDVKKQSEAQNKTTEQGVSTEQKDRETPRTDETPDSAATESERLTEEKSVTDDVEVCSVKEEESDAFHLDVFWRYVDETFSTPFALSREKDKPKVKVSERFVKARTLDECYEVN